jgi:hypothetical protein
VGLGSFSRVSASPFLDPYSPIFILQKEKRKKKKEKRKKEKTILFCSDSSTTPSNPHSNLKQYASTALKFFKISLSVLF